MRKKIVINGDFLYRYNITGVQRYALEVIKKLDKIDQDNIEYILLVPSDCKESNIPELNKIKVVKYKKYCRFLWLQFALMWYCIKANAYALCLCTLAPYFYYKKSFNVIHDAAVLVHPEFYNKKYKLMQKILLWNKINKLKGILTISNFSKAEIAKHSKLKDPTNIGVAFCAADEFCNTKIDNKIFECHKELIAAPYCLAVSSLSPNKNFKWVLKVADSNPKFIFCIVGKESKIFSRNNSESKVPSNVIFTGYISDEEIKALMKKCYLFLSSSVYEGFGITPLEALSTGCDVAVSDIDVFHEIYGNSVSYFDPNKYDYDISELKMTHDKSICEKYSWDKTANSINDFIYSSLKVEK